ncbi:MAG: TolC family protein, partial [Verrucomicrobia bacterium]|nr:TolC family protein [Verrucomicrobiota bacterium]
IRMVEVEKAEVRRQMTLELSDAYQSLRQASLAVKSLNDRLLPAAQTTLDETQTGYQRGQFSLQAVLGSREALFEIRQQQFDAISQYLKAKTQIENLTQSVSL